MTLNELIKKHPEWADLPIAIELVAGVSAQDGGIRFIAMKSVSAEKDYDNEDVLVFNLS